MTPAEEQRAVKALVALSSRQVGVERAALSSDPNRADPEGDAEGLRIARDHGVDADRLSAYRTLARSRGVDLEHVLRAAFRGGLREIVELPESRNDNTRRRP